MPKTRHALATWNVGGLQARRVLQLCDELKGTSSLRDARLLLVQEVVCEPGVQFASDKNWQIIFGKFPDEWRGTAICYQLSLASHRHTQLYRGGISAVLHFQQDNSNLGLVSGHIPWNATIAEAEHYARDWGEATASKQPRCIWGIDANETFRQTGGGTSSSSGRGESLLNIFHELDLTLPPQDLHLPSHFPYNTQYLPRRLDYLLSKGSTIAAGCTVGDLRDMASSDHEPIIGSTTAVKGRPTLQTSWGARTLKPKPVVDQHLQQPPQGHDPHQQVAALAIAITQPCTGRTAPYAESKTLKDMRWRAHRTPAGTDRRQAWRAIQKLRKQEHKEWERALVDRASRLDWKAMRTLDHLHRAAQWEHHLLDDPDWQTHLKTHFRNIFAKANAEDTRQQMAKIRAHIAWQCKHTPWVPFTETEMWMAASKWSARKATGPDQISHEALHMMMTTKTWTGKLQYILNDLFYMGAIPSDIAGGITILLPKTTTPASWGDTRPITLSSSLLKWTAQLLLQRAGGRLITSPLQWAAPGRQAIELIWVIRRILRMAVDWGENTYLVKLDIRKAFDSTSQPALGDLVSRKIAGEGGLPWEARLWLSIIEARELCFAVGDTLTPIQQTNGVRQGSPDSPELFAAMVGDSLDHALSNAGPPPQFPPCPAGGGSYMDDTYLWKNNRAHLQAKLTHLEGQLNPKGLEIHPGKTAIIASHDTGATFTIGGQQVAAQGPDTVITGLGSPLTFHNVASALAAELGGRARRAFHMRKKVLCAKTPLKGRLQLHDTYVRSTALWGCPTWPIHETLLKQANSTQQAQVRQMMGHSRRAGESWSEWNTRTLRLARLALHFHGIQRWSTWALQNIWSFTGHVARGGSMTTEVAAWKNIEWWRVEQNKRGGIRHAKRFSPNLDPERQIVSIAGEQWLQQAQDRGKWKALTAVFVERFDAPWTSGKQGAVKNLAPARRGGKPTAPTPTRPLALADAP